MMAVATSPETPSVQRLFMALSAGGMSC